MGLCLIGDLIAGARRQDKSATIVQFCMQFAFQAQQDVALLAPMVGQIIGTVGDHPNADVPKILGPPDGVSRLALMSCF